MPHPPPLTDLAAQIVHYTDRHLFLTGKAGTGKTTFLRRIVAETHKRAVVAAPTGVAAIHAGGTTLHSLLQLPLGMFIPEGTVPPEAEALNEEVHDRHSLMRKLRLSGSKKQLLQALELLIIDEVSMVRADLLDMVDAVLRQVRRRPREPFGGVQVLYIGDLLQLPPVVKDEQRTLLQQYYRSPYFFDARVIAEAPPLYIELQEVFRQRDDRFLDLLSQVRTNRLTPDGLALLQSRYMPGFEPPDEPAYITLTTHHYQADRINAARLDALQGAPKRYDAEVDGDFPVSACPADEKLTLKEGAQVMFLKNDTQQPRRYFNGRIGTVHQLHEDEIEVICPGGDAPISVARDVWRNIRYRYLPDTGSVDEEELGSFRQFPLRLAWAVTIHKSQGLTFERAIVDAGRAFAPGQVYVALSRCTKLEGLVLRSALHEGLIFTDPLLAAMTARERPLEEIIEALREGRQLYLRRALLECCEWTKPLMDAEALRHEAGGLPHVSKRWLDAWEEISRKLQQLAQQAMPHVDRLRPMIGSDQDPEADATLQSALQAYAAALLPGLEQLPQPPKAVAPYSARSEAIAARAQQLLDRLRQRREHLLRLRAGFSAETFFAPRQSVVREAMLKSVPPKQVPESDTALSHPELFEALRQLRNELSRQQGVPAYVILHNTVLRALSEWMPLTTEDLLEIPGFGEKKLQQYGEAVLEVIRKYRQTQEAGAA